MDDATENDGPLATDLGDAPRKLPRDGIGQHRIDVADQDQVFELARELMRARDRRMIQATHAELRAVARLAVIAAPIWTHAVALVEASDSGQARPDTAKALEALIALTRQMMEAAHVA